MAMRRCPATNCPHLIHTHDRYCTEHARAYEQSRGTAHQRGYGTTHRTLRNQWQRTINQGNTYCARCGLLILPTEPWDLGHTTDRASYTGPEHAHCNRADGGRRGALARNQNT